MELLDYETLTKTEKLNIVAKTEDEDVIHFAFYDNDLDIKLELCQNERLPLGKLKRYTNDREYTLRQKAIEVYERRLVY